MMVDNVCKDKLQLKNFFINIFFTIIIFWSYSTLAVITQSTDFQEIESLMQKADEQTLFIFDIQDVLLQADDQILKVNNKKYYDALKNEFITSKFSKDKAKELSSIIWLQRNNGPVDIKFVDLIKNLQDRHVKIIALTNCATGRFGQIESIENWRLDELKRSGYDFGKSWPNLKSNAKLVKKSKISYTDGVIFTTRISKNEALEAFLKYSKFNPQKIIFIDDKKVHLQQVEKLAEQRNIKFYGLEYKAAREAILPPCDELLAKFQFKYLVKNYKWLSDEQARTMLK